LKAPPPSAGYPPSDACLEVLDRLRRLLDEVAVPAAAALGDTAFAVEADGRLAAPLVELKRRLQREAAGAGLYCPHLQPPDGLGLSLVDCFYLQEEVFRHGLGGSQWVLAWTDGPSPLVRFWSDEARDAFLADFLAGRSNVAFAATEPGAGSDLRAVRTEARREGAGWVLRGEKHLITGAPFAELAQVLARTDAGLSLFLCPFGSDGVERGPVQQTLMADGQTGSLSFHDVRLPASALIGGDGDGLRLAFVWINWARTRRGGMCSGLAHHCLERSRAYSAGRAAYGRPIAELGPVATFLADLLMDREAMRAVSLELLARLDRSRIFDGEATADDRRDLSVLKAWNDEALYRVADRAIQIHGGRGLLTETGLEKIFRVARNLRIPAGTTEVQRDQIAKTLVGAPRSHQPQ
jgi:alkylation response protein AidB-like acyl-CoA dehydrogenase